MSGIGAYIRDVRPIMVDIQIDSARSTVSRTKNNLDASNRQMRMTVSRVRGIYNHLAMNVDKYA